MPLLSNYVIRTVLGYTALVMLVLLALGALFLFIGQQDDIGTGDYTAAQAGGGLTCRSWATTSSARSSGTRHW